MNTRQRQAGATLVVALIILITLTLFVVSSTNLVATDLRIASNVQGKKIAQSVAQLGIEEILSHGAYLATPTSHTLNIDGLQVNVLQPTCLASTPVSGYFMTSSSQHSLAPTNTQWEVQASTSDPVTGAAVVIRQGVAVRMPVGAICP